MRRVRRSRSAADGMFSALNATSCAWTAFSRASKAREIAPLTSGFSRRSWASLPRVSSLRPGAAGAGPSCRRSSRGGGYRCRAGVACHVMSLTLDWRVMWRQMHDRVQERSHGLCEFRVTRISLWRRRGKTPGTLRADLRRVSPGRAGRGTTESMNKRKLTVALTAGAVATAGFGAAVLPANAELRTFRVTLVTGQVVTVQSRPARRASSRRFPRPCSRCVDITPPAPDVPAAARPGGPRAAHAAGSRARADSGDQPDDDGEPAPRPSGDGGGGPQDEPKTGDGGNRQPDDRQGQARRRRRPGRHRPQRQAARPRPQAARAHAPA